MSAARILYCHCAFAQVVPPETKTAVLDRLCAASVSYDAVPDLCEMSARRDPELAALAASGETTIVACYPRAVRWLFNGAGLQLPETVRILNMREQSAEEVTAALDLDGAAV